jgi:hypothetical protein
MAEDRVVIWKGISGRQYRYYAYPIGTSFKSQPGNYIFAQENANGIFAVYVGETSDLSERFENHHKSWCIARNGATHIHAHLNHEGPDARRAEELDIKNNYDPPCNG